MHDLICDVNCGVIREAVIYD